MEIKYEAVFGPQDLFDGVPEYIEVIRFNDYSRDYLWSDLDKIKHLTFRDLKAIPIVAMRRIIRTPTWTVADQKAGKLPEVGCEVMVSPKTKATVTAVDSIRKVVAVQYDDGSLDILRSCEILQIESPEEKAARLREEWCANAAKQLKNLEYSSTLTSIYDAILSGELKMPEVQK